MKKKFNILHLVGVVIGCIVLAGLVMCGMTSCKNITLPWGEKTPAIEETVDSISQLAVAEAINPTFDSADMVVMYRNMLLEDKTVDSTFEAMPEPVLFNVAYAVIKQQGTAKKRDIVEEYFSHSAVYDNLPQPQSDPTAQNAPPSEDNPGVKKDEKGDVISTSYRYHTDTVDGQPIKVQIKEEKSYVK
jgi:hypothetical protein